MVCIMAIGAEKRRYPRVFAVWSAVVQTLQGPLEAKTRDISVGGVFIECPEKIDLGENFQIMLKPPQGRSITVTGRRAWSGNINFNGRSTYSGMGVQFTALSPEDRNYISTLAEKKLDDLSSAMR